MYTVNVLGTARIKTMLAQTIMVAMSPLKSDQCWMYFDYKSRKYPDGLYLGCEGKVLEICQKSLFSGTGKVELTLSECGV